MKKFKLAEIDNLLKQVHREEITFSRFVEIINERIQEPVQIDTKNPFEKFFNNPEYIAHKERIEQQRKLGKL